jgi:shikimate kinase
VARFVIVGLPGTGKSTIAKLAAKRMGCTAIDLDTLIAQREGAHVGELIRRTGEPAFRVLERAALEVACTHDAIVATGGGVVTTHESREILLTQRCVWLDATDEVLLPRLEHGDRPLLGGDAARALVELRAHREALYEAVADVRIDASGSAKLVTDRVLQWLGD